MEGRVDPLAEASSPTRRIPGDAERGAPEPGLALCLSGGGYRAMLFHLGVLWRLNELGYLPRLDRISSVSGGSITAARLGAVWGSLAFDAGGVARAFGREVVEPVRGFAGTTIDVSRILGGLLTPGSIADKVTGAYRARLLGRKTLQDLPDRPRFVVNATNLQSAVLWRFSKPYMWDYRVGKVERPTVELAVAVAASAAFPPFLSPLVLELSESDYVPGTGDDLQRPPFTTRVFLTDGGVYDNLGLETAWKRHGTILVSDGGGHIEPEESPPRDWARQMVRVTNVIDSQVRALRKRQVISSYEANLRDGAYWGIRSDIRKFPAENTLPCPFEATTRLADVPTRLAAMERVLQERLVNWGYAVCDAGMRAHVDRTLPAPAGFPYPASGVG